MELFSIRIQRTFQLVSTSLGWWHQDFPDHFTYGGRAGVSLESEHFIYTIDGKCSLRKRPFGQSGSLSAGVGYKF